MRALSAVGSNEINHHHRKENDMSLAIDVDRVRAVLLDDGWHEVDSASFTLDAYEYHYRDRMLVGGGRVEGVPSTGFSFTDQTGGEICGPLDAVLAVRLGE
jgi:hypothetical protein